MKPLALASLLALAAPAVDAGDVGFRIGIGIQHKGVNVRVGVGNTGPRAKHAPAPAPRPKVRYRRHRHHRHHRVWVPGHYEVVQTKVWVPAYTRKVWRPAQYGHRRDRCGFRVRYLVRPGYWETIYVPGHWDYRSQKVWRPGHYRMSPRARHRRGHRI